MFIALRLLSNSAPSGATCKLSAHHIALLQRGAYKNRTTMNIVLLRSTSLRNRAGPNCSAKATHRCFASKVQIPPTAVGGSFKSFLQTNSSIDVLNPANGSWRKFQVLSISTLAYEN